MKSMSIPTSSPFSAATAMNNEKRETTPLCKMENQQASERMPPTWVSYIKLTRIHKFPAGSDLVFWPSSWGIALAAHSIKKSPTSFCLQLVVYLIGSTLRHNSACIWNDMCDIDFDKKVARSKGRPLARGLVSMTGAATFLLAHLLVCVLILSYIGSTTAFRLGLLGLFFIDAVYPLMKRVTDWPQAWLGIAMTWGLPVAWIANTNYMNWPLISTLYLGGICWTLHYDTIYACQDRKDDIKAGIRSTAVLFGDNVRPILASFSTCFVLSLALAGMMNGNGPAYFMISVGGTIAHLIWQLTTLDFDVGTECWRMFKANGSLGALILFGLVCDYCLAVFL